MGNTTWIYTMPKADIVLTDLYSKVKFNDIGKTIEVMNQLYKTIADIIKLEEKEQKWSSSDLKEFSSWSSDWKSLLFEIEAFTTTSSTEEETNAFLEEHIEENFDDSCRDFIEEQLTKLYDLADNYKVFLG